MNCGLFPWLKERSCGVLMHPTSLPGELGIGNLGKPAYRFVDFLAAVGMGNWQVCPLGPTGFGDSPYQSFSSFAGNPYLIDLQPLVAHGLLSATDLKPLHRLPQDWVDYGALYTCFFRIMRAASNRFIVSPRDLPGYGDFEKFVAAHTSWLLPYAAFTALKMHHQGKPWYAWPTKYRSFENFKKTPLFSQLEDEFSHIYFQQYLFFAQLAQLRQHAHDHGVQLIGDIPIFVSPDSADIWTHPELFQITKAGKMTAVAGVPPDYFSETGQLWGNPLYKWPAHHEQDYAWWKQRLKHHFTTFDRVRLDHFRGFYEYWSIPAGAADARPGKWVPGPQLDFFQAIRNAIPDAQLIAEDLGEATPGLFEFRDATGLPGMAILQFGFGGNNDNLYLPHNLDRNCIVYPGNHDNDTTLGWYNKASDSVKHHFRSYFQCDGNAPHWDLIRATYASVGRLGIIPLQDLLGLDSTTRLNTPGTASGNWQWRFTASQLDQLWTQQASYLQHLKSMYNR